jgi:hypothetical protein
VETHAELEDRGDPPVGMNASVGGFAVPVMSFNNVLLPAPL